MPELLSVAAALAAVLDRAGPLPPEPTVLPTALGKTLAEVVVADLDLPPFAKALMDGYAVRSADLAASGTHRLAVVGEVLAGQTLGRAVEPGEAVRIMTGAPVPAGLDAVVPFERTTNPGGALALVEINGPVAAGASVLPRGRESRAGEVLLGPGTRINPLHLGLLASVGRTFVAAVPDPRVVVVPTGDEVVRVAARPGPGQIRNSNGPMLAGLARGWGSRIVQEHPIAPDDPAGLRDHLRAALGAADVLLVAGGVSAGDRDLVPAALVDLGITPVFHKVAVKPGKPIWFGVGPRRPDGRPGPLVFGLPGNPASAVVGFLLFVRPALDALAARIPTQPYRTMVRLTQPFDHRGDRPTFHPARLDPPNEATPLAWAGSADLRTVALADGFVSFPAGDRHHPSGAEVEFLHS